MTQQEVAHLDAKKVLTMLAQAEVPVLGGVENMAAFHCPGCGTAIELFPSAPLERSIWAAGVRRLGAIPFMAQQPDCAGHAAGSHSSGPTMTPSGGGE